MEIWSKLGQNSLKIIEDYEEKQMTTELVVDSHLTNANETRIDTNKYTCKGIGHKYVRIILGERQNYYVCFIVPLEVIDDNCSQAQSNKTKLQVFTI